MNKDLKKVARIAMLSESIDAIKDQLSKLTELQSILEGGLTNEELKAYEELTQ